MTREQIKARFPSASEAFIRANLERYGVACACNVNGRKASWKAQWATVGGQRLFARSSWEVNYARFLEFRKQQQEITSWKHEPKTFWFEKVLRGCVSYKPDFEVHLPNGKIEYHEVKGWMDVRSKTVLNRMRIYHPEVTIVLVDAKRYKAIMRTAGAFLPKPEASKA
jgi:hypothetical protein